MKVESDYQIKNTTYQQIQSVFDEDKVQSLTQKLTSIQKIRILTLNLSGNRLQDQDISNLTIGLAQCIQIASLMLDLSNNNIQSGGISFLGRGLKIVEIQDTLLLTYGKIVQMIMEQPTLAMIQEILNLSLPLIFIYGKIKLEMRALFILDKGLVKVELLGIFKLIAGQTAFKSQELKVFQNNNKAVQIQTLQFLIYSK
ncbi:hypothetical protein ABPG72_018969 [Tetrahymena utriculariae]